MRTKRTVISSLAVVLFVFAGRTFASDLNGNSVTVNYLYPNMSTVYQTLGTGTVTGAGFTTNSFGQHQFTVFPSEITLTNVLGSDVNFLIGSFNGYQMIDNTGSPAITGVTVAFNDVAGFTASDVSFDATDVWINMQGLTTTPGLDLQLDLQFASTSVPEPGSLLLFGTALLGMAPLVLKRITS